MLWSASSMNAAQLEAGMTILTSGDAWPAGGLALTGNTSIPSATPPLRQHGHKRRTSRKYRDSSTDLSARLGGIQCLPMTLGQCHLRAAMPQVNVAARAARATRTP